MSQITILQAAETPPKRLSKVFMLDTDKNIQSIGYDRCKHFKIKLREVSNIEDLSNLLLKLENRSDLMVIRGAPRDDVDQSKTVFRQTYDPRKGITSQPPQEKPFEDMPISWVMIDVDKQQLPSGMDLIKDTDMAIGHIVSQLPLEFQGASYHWQLSSSAGIYNTDHISIHLWFWLSSPQTSMDLREWAKTFNLTKGKSLIDTALFQAVQPHYTSAPSLLNGISDPLNSRSGLTKCSTQSVDIDFSIQAPTLIQDSASPLDEQGGRRLLHHSTTTGFDNILATMGDNKEGFYTPILRAVASCMSTNGGPMSNDDSATLKEAIREQASTADKSASRLSDGSLAKYLSDSHLDKMIIDTASKLDFGSTSMSPHFDTKRLPLLEAVAKLHDTIDQFTTSVFHFNQSDNLYIETPSLGIKASAGLGKTSSIIRRCLDSGAFSGNIEFYVPSHALSAELEVDLKAILDIDLSQYEIKDFSRIGVILGRSKTSKNGVPLCMKPKEADKLGKLGISVKKTLCKDKAGNECQFLHGCLYQKQFTEETLPTSANPSIAAEIEVQGGLTMIEDFRPAVRVMAHTHLFLHTRDDLPAPELIVIDESFFSVGIEEHKIELAELIMSEGKLVKQVLDALLTKEPLIDLLRANGLTSYTLRNEANKYDQYTNLGINPSTTSSVQVKDIDQAEPLSKLGLMFTMLADEMSLFDRGVCHSVRLAGKGKKAHIKLSRRMPMTIPRNVPVLFIDADLNKSILDQFRPSVPVVDISVERLGTVIQITDKTFSLNDLTGSSYSVVFSQTEDFIQRIKATGGSTLIVTNKDVRLKLTNEDESNIPMIGDYHGASIIHFGNLRGLNEFKEFENVIIIGRNEVPQEAIEQVAGGVWWDSEDELGLSATSADGMSYEKRGYTDRQSAGKGSGTRVHPDKRVQMIQEQNRECETTQAIDRLRLLRPNTEGCDRKVFVLSSVPLDLVVDHLVSWKKLQDFIGCWKAGGGIVPLNTQHLKKVCRANKSDTTLDTWVASFRTMLPVISMIMADDEPILSDYRVSKAKLSAAIHSKHMKDLTLMINKHL